MSKTKSTLRSLMDKKANGDTGRRMQLTTHYSKLPQHISDDDEEEMNIEVHQSENHQNYNNHKQEIVELEKLYPTDSAQEEILIQGQRLSRARTVCFALSLFFCVAFTLAFIFVAPCHQLPCDSIKENKTAEWEKTFHGYAIATHIVLVEGEHHHQNILLALIPIKDNGSDLIEECQSIGYSQCTVLLLLQGNNAKEICKFSFKSLINFIICQSDLNNDGYKDCIVSGTASLLIAIDPNKGEILWKSDSPLLKPSWNIFTPQVLQDFDGDGISDFAVWMNCEQISTKSPEHDRLVMISGKSGSIMPYYLEIPGSKQSSMPPIVYKKGDGSSYILLSSIEESENTAALWMISFPDFYRLVENFPENYVISKIEGAYKQWPGLIPNDLGVLKIYSSHAKGFPVTPLIVDLTQDGIDDIVVEQDGSSVIVLNGVTWDVVWQRNFEGWESFSSIAPGYFNNDSILDLMVHMNLGKWSDYNASMVCVLDGKTGQTLWSFSSALADFSSPLSLHTTIPYRDAFAFAVSGRFLPARTSLKNKYLSNYFLHVNKHNTLEPIENLPEKEHYFSHIITPKMSHVHKELSIHQALIPGLSLQEHFESQSEEMSWSDLSQIAGDQTGDQTIADSRKIKQVEFCGEASIPHMTEVFLVDRTMKKTALLLTTFDFGQYHYNISEKIQKEMQIPLASNEFCAFYETTGILTGAVGDVDADGCLDLVVLSVAHVTLINNQVHYDIKLKKINIAKKLSDSNYIEINSNTENSSSSDESLPVIRFTSLQSQSWNQFLGAHSNSRYS